MAATTEAPDTHPEGPGAPDGAGRARPWLLAAAAMFTVVLLALSLQGTVRPLQRFDEGTCLVEGWRLAQGEVPLRDFVLSYGVLEPALLALPIELFGPELLLLRLLRALCMAGLATAAAACCWRSGARAGAVAVAAAVLALASTAMSFNGSLFVLVLALVLLDRYLARDARWAVLGAGALVGVAGLFRADMGLLGCLTGAATLAGARLPARDGRRLLRDLGWFCAGGAPFLLVLVAVTALGWEEYFAYIHDYAQVIPYYELPYPWPWKTTLTGWPAVGLWLVTLLPPLVLLAAPPLLLRSLWRARRDDVPGPAPLLVGLTALLGGLCVYAVHRFDGPHLFPGFVVAATLVGVALAPLEARLAERTRRYLLLCAVSGLALVAGDRVWSALALRHDPTRVTSSVPGLRGIVIPRAQEAEFQAALAALDQVCGPDEPIYVGLSQHQRIVINDVLFYALARRPIATRRHILFSGLSTTEAEQRKVIAELERGPTRVIVLVDGGWYPQPNRSQELGSPLLDETIRARYRRVAKRGAYGIWVRETP